MLFYRHWQLGGATAEPRLPLTKLTLFVWASIIGFGGCQKAVEVKVDAEKEEAVVNLHYKAALPANPKIHGPSFARLMAGEKYRPEIHQDVQTCVRCHPDHVGQWRESMHAFSSFNNPLYRMAFDDYVGKVGPEKAAFCGGCHDTSMIFDGSIAKKIEPNDPRAHTGITCNGCHGIVKATTTGVASYVVTTTPIPIPEEGNPESLVAHRARVGMKGLRSEAMCISCHRGFLSEASGHEVFVPALDEFGPWRHSAYANSHAGIFGKTVQQATCVDCHMKEYTELKPDGKIATRHSHRFAGGHTAFAAAIGSKLQLANHRSLVENVAYLDIPLLGQGREPGYPSEDPWQPSPAHKDIWFDVVLANTGVAHHFPGGARDLRDTWLEVTLEDKDGKIIAESGAGHIEDPIKADAHILHAGVVDEKGRLVKSHSVSHFRTAAYDHTIAPLDAQVIRYRWALPKGEQLPSAFRMKAKLHQRRLSEAFQNAACEASKTKRGALFNQAAQKYTGLKVDICTAQPVVLLAEHEILVDGGQHVPQNSEVMWARWYWHGLASSHLLQEKLDQAVNSFRRAQKFTGQGPGSTHKDAMLRAGLADVLVRQGRVEEALEEIAKVSSIYKDHPALARIRGDAMVKLWRYKDAIEPYKLAAKNAPRDMRCWKSLATSYGSLKQYPEALDAAQRGLQIEPRNVDLLRVQMLALNKLRPQSEQALVARKTFLEFKRDEAAPEIRSRCSDESSVCLRERLPGHVHEMRRAEAKGN